MLILFVCWEIQHKQQFDAWCEISAERLQSTTGELSGRYNLIVNELWCNDKGSNSKD